HPGLAATRSMKLTIAVRRRPFPSKEHLLLGAIGNALTSYRTSQRLLHRTNVSARVPVPTMMCLPSPPQPQAFTNLQKYPRYLDELGYVSISPQDQCACAAAQPRADRFWLTAGGSRSVSPAAILGDFKASGRTAQ